jgi:hypothetical protein
LRPEIRTLRSWRRVARFITNSSPYAFVYR